MIVKVMGGIGNQMFQIALAQALYLCGNDIKIDDSDLNEYLSERKWENIFNIFQIELKRVNKQDIIQIKRSKKNSPRQKLIRRLFKTIPYYRENIEGNFDEEIFKIKDGYLEGYWQTEKYFSAWDSQIMKLYSFPPIDDAENMNYELMIKAQSCSVSIHVRRGDYLEGINNEIYGGICTERYYKAAISYIEDRFPECHFFVFSNDFEYVAKLFQNENITVISGNEGQKAWIDMYLMSICNHNIIANSSFSWWGAWLNQNKEKIVIAPRKWINTKEMKDVCPNSWIRI